eukprot:CAMPEP_0168442690 /NCGR_PEP_ID=MMETSP0228-20121227/44142_1 /TAXON_ID=133427 /ORGANISM="Protoceratium reticulatum, Strain CCCM 535 (=CCMP 1889)" /LENGTH=223 /DNA_ID=CAMNT_0008457067 /DNA_START=49 /DNA_END=716 /DNA_ORIENTATION=-
MIVGGGPGGAQFTTGGAGAYGASYNTASMAGGSVAGGRMVYGGAGAAGGRVMGGGAGAGANAGDCAGTCGGAEAACCEAEGAVLNTNWAYVGEGMGSYANVPSYNYVGRGCGSFEKEVTTTYYGWKFRKCCIGLLACLLIPALIYLLMTLTGVLGVTADTSAEVADQVPVTPAPTQPVPVTTREPFNCAVGGLWSISEKTYCCRKYGRGCTTQKPTTPPPPPA